VPSPYRSLRERPELVHAVARAAGAGVDDVASWFDRVLN
jgi:hypothetical protein